MYGCTTTTHHMERFEVPGHERIVLGANSLAYRTPLWSGSDRCVPMAELHSDQPKTSPQSSNFIQGQSTSRNDESCLAVLHIKEDVQHRCRQLRDLESMSPIAGFASWHRCEQVLAKSHCTKVVRCPNLTATVGGGGGHISPQQVVSSAMAPLSLGWPSRTRTTGFFMCHFIVQFLHQRTNDVLGSVHCVSVVGGQRAATVAK